MPFVSTLHEEGRAGPAPLIATDLQEPLPFAQGEPGEGSVEDPETALKRAAPEGDLKEGPPYV
ncbi:hypothetical protein PF003_g24892 [Phytophthora fragariae]|nr:hypothetical protein PF003_g24892 [Phytophthora fragariae]